MLHDEIAYLEKIYSMFNSEDEIALLINDVKAIVYSKTGLYDSESVCHDILHKLEHIEPSTRLFTVNELNDSVNSSLYCSMMQLKFAKETVFKIVYLHEILANTDIFLHLMLNNISYHNAQVQFRLGPNIFVLDASFFSSAIHGDTSLIVMRHLMDKYSISLTNILKHSSYDVLDSIFSANYISASTVNQIAFINTMLLKRNNDLRFLISPIINGYFSTSIRRSMLLNENLLSCYMHNSDISLSGAHILAIKNFFNTNTFSTGFLINKIIEDFHTKGSVTDSTTVFSDMSLLSLMCINPYLDDHAVKSIRKAIINTNDDKEEGKELSSPMPSMFTMFSHQNSHLRHDTPQRKSL